MGAMKKVGVLRRRTAVTTAGTVVRVDRRTKDLAKRLQPGDIAVIDHADIDRVAAESLLAAQPSAIVNASPSITGRYPNMGPTIIVSSGIPLLDDAGPEVMRVTEGETASFEIDDDGAHLVVGGRAVGAGDLLTPDRVAHATEEARAGLSTQLESFAANTMDYMIKERDLLFDGVGVPDTRTSFEGRQALVVVRGYHYQEDLVVLGPYIREYRPVIIGVDGGADAVLAAGYRLDMIVGDMDSVSDKALSSGAEIVVHAYRDGHAPGLKRVRGLGVEPVVFPATGTSEDIAMLMADDKGASVIVAVGTHATLEEFLDKGRAGMASTFLTRLRIGGKLVDAKGVSRLYRQRISNRQLALLLGAGLFAFCVALLSTAVGRVLLNLGAGTVQDAFVAVVDFFGGLFR